MGLEFCDTLVSVKAEMAPKIIISVQNPTNHKIILSGRTVIGSVQLVQAEYPVNIIDQNHLPASSIHCIHAQATGENTPPHENWDPPINLTPR